MRTTIITNEMNQNQIKRKLIASSLMFIVIVRSVLKLFIKTGMNRKIHYTCMNKKKRIQCWSLTAFHLRRKLIVDNLFTLSSIE